jgi:hypothetical protein
MLRTLTALGALLAVLAFGQTPASAHTDKVFHGKDVAIVTSDHMHGTVCDEERDGHWVAGEWFLANGDTITTFDGGDAPCANTVNFDSPAWGFRVCEEGKGCVEEKT